MRAGRGETPAPAAELFRDADFPASDSSLCCSLSTPLAQFREDITWRRPQEICVAPRLFPDSAREGQVKQGLLGDCWFLCACAALHKHRHLLDQVIPPGQPSWADEAYRGAFTCRVWQFGRWVEVTVDDRLPCLAGRLCFSRCRGEDVFWLPLLEKVYANPGAMNDTCGSGNLTWPRWLEHTFSAYLALLLVLGLLLNGLALWVFCRRMQGWTEARVYMTSLAGADLCLLCALPFMLHSLKHTSDTPLCQLSQAVYLLNSKLSDANCCLDAICYYYTAREFQEASALGRPHSAKACKSHESLCVTLT